MAKTPMVSELAGDLEMHAIVEDFVRNLPDRIRMMEVALSQQDYTALINLAHQLKGAGGGYGFPVITEAAGHLEESVAYHDCLENIKSRLDELAAICQRARSTAATV